ncbi:hypothetical protein VB712_12775 [Spirulina sp. CCNP1310]|uniref:hypothetical protein n=1 Tax=Spirulina sp. CCNP1310 TaxID=3110249 RepID=UPI002B2016C1|nr:hypothetical protein [Spirulina sp. CCNP1310]MEA5420097.1 hypothetical protein [Spirulina sp. CCNP1310]
MRPAYAPFAKVTSLTADAAESVFLEALTLCDQFLHIDCIPARVTPLVKAIHLLTPLLVNTDLWFALLDAHQERVHWLRSQLEDQAQKLQYTAACQNRTTTCPQFCEPAEQCMILAALLSV